MEDKLFILEIHVICMVTASVTKLRKLYGIRTLRKWLLTDFKLPNSTVTFTVTGKQICEKKILFLFSPE